MEDLVGEPSTHLGSVLEGRRVLVTGHTGFKGAWLSSWLGELGASVFGYALAPATEPDLFSAIGLEQRMDHAVGDVRDLEAVTARIRRVEPDLILHLAAEAIVRESYRAPQRTFATNVLGTVNVLEAVRVLERPCTVVVVSSDKCYRSHPSRAHAEDDPLGGHDPYSASKAAAELVTASYRSSFFDPERYEQHGVALASARAGNVIGGGDWAPDRLVPDIFRAVVAGERPRIRNPRAVRPWQHVLDALSGYLWLAASMVERGPDGLAEGWNFGPAEVDAIPVGELADRVLRLWGQEGWQPADERKPAHETQYLRLDCTKARERLAWRPTWDVDAALRATVDWFGAWNDGRDLARHTRDQIRSFTSAARERDVAWAAPARQAVRP